MPSDVSDEPTRARRLTSAARRDQLLDVAEELFVARGFAAVTMEDIARGAGVSRPMPYRHFGTKEGVFLACAERVRVAYVADMMAAIDPDADPKAQLEQGVDAYFASLERHPGRWRLLFGSSGVLPGSYGDQLAGLRFATVATLTELLRAAAATDAPGRLVEAMAHGMSGVAERLGHWWLAEPDLTRAELVDYFVALCWQGAQSALVRAE